MSGLWSVAGVVVAVGSGLAWVAGVGLGQRWIPRAMACLAHCVPLGFGLLSVASFAFLLCGQELADAWVMLIVATFAGGALGWCGRGWRRAVPRTGSGMGAVAIVASLVLVVAVISAVVVLHRSNGVRPDGVNDAMAIWNTHARFLYRGGGPAGELMREKEVGAPDYPLYGPAALAGLWHLGGRETREIAQAVALLSLLALGAMVVAALARRTETSIAALGAALVLATPVVVFVAQDQYMDVALALVLLAVVSGLRSWGEGSEPEPPVVTGFLLGLLPWIKNEGVVLLPLVLVVFSAVVFRRKHRRRLGLMLLGALPPLLCVVAFKACWAADNYHLSYGGAGLWDRLGDGSRWEAVLSGLLGELDPRTGSKRWGLSWMVLLALVPACRARRLLAWPSLATGVVFLGTTAAWLTVLVASPRPVDWQTAVAMDRLLLHTYPVAVLWILGSLVEPTRRRLVPRRRLEGVDAPGTMPPFPAR